MTVHLTAFQQHVVAAINSHHNAAMEYDIQSWILMHLGKSVLDRRPVGGALANSLVALYKRGLVTQDFKSGEWMLTKYAKDAGL